jgi:hypothetical protein
MILSDAVSRQAKPSWVRQLFAVLEEAQEYVFGAYLEKKLYGQVLEYLLTNFNWEWDINNYVHTAKLWRENELATLKRELPELKL